MRCRRAASACRHTEHALVPPSGGRRQSHTTRRTLMQRIVSLTLAALLLGLVSALVACTA